MTIANATVATTAIMAITVIGAPPLSLPRRGFGPRRHRVAVAVVAMVNRNRRHPPSPSRLPSS
jgi:hypothetical protein